VFVAPAIPDPETVQRVVPVEKVRPEPLAPRSTTEYPVTPRVCAGLVHVKVIVPVPYVSVAVPTVGAAIAVMVVLEVLPVDELYVDPTAATVAETTAVPAVVGVQVQVAVSTVSEVAVGTTAFVVAQVAMSAALPEL
jgi:hypothetical protein